MSDQKTLDQKNTDLLSLIYNKDFDPSIKKNYEDITFNYDDYKLNYHAKSLRCLIEESSKKSSSDDIISRNFFSKIIIKVGGESYRLPFFLYYFGGITANIDKSFELTIGDLWEKYLENFIKRRFHNLDFCTTDKFSNGDEIGDLVFKPKYRNSILVDEITNFWVIFAFETKYSDVILSKAKNL